MSRCRQKNTSRRRGRRGMYMVETLVALILGTLLCFALLEILAQTMRVASHNSNQQVASLIAQSVLDVVKAQDSSNLVIGTYPLLVNSTTAGELAPAGHPLPVGLNIGSLQWTDKSKFNQFPGTVVLDIRNGTDPLTLEAIVTVAWADSQALTTKTVATMTKLHPRGINLKWR